MARLSLALLGGFHAGCAPTGGPVTLTRAKARALLAYLALRPGQTCSREGLTALLWGDTDAQQARNSFRVTLFALRRALRSAKIACLSVEDSAVALDPAAVDVDVLKFRRLVAEGTPEALGAATDLYAGDLLEGISVGEAAFEEWLTGEREQFRALAFHAFDGLLTHQLASGAEEASLGTALRLLALDPLQEPVHRTVMRLQAALDRPGAALRQYQACVAVLQRELGIAPALETQELYQQILRREVPVTARRAPAGAERRRRAAFPTTGLTQHRLPASPELVGRRVEMERLRTAIAEAARGRGGAVAVLGEAGIGKTRLLAAAAAEAQHQGYRLLLGRSSESERILPLAPWVDAIRAGGVLGDARVFEELGASWTAELARLFPEIGSPPPALAAGHSRLFESMARLLTQLAARQPLAVILEDLHWADDLSARLLGFVARRAASWPLLLVVSARDEELASASVLRRVLDELARTEAFARLVLAPLDRRDAMRLVRTLVRTGRSGPDVVPLAERIWAVSHGNPFMIVETVNWLGDEALPPTEVALPLPPRVREVVASRLERLSERSRRLLGLAAVLGRTFEFALLSRASGLGGIDAAEGVEELVRRRLLHAVGDGLDVTHDWIREIAYAQLHTPLRQALHAAVAGAIEAHYSGDLEPHLAALATHYRAGQVWDKAFAYLHGAGRAAAARFGHRAAVARYEDALDVARHLPQTRDVLDRVLDLRIDLRYSLSGLGDFDRLAHHLREAEPLARRLADERRLGWVQVYLSYHARMTGRLDEARELSARARAIAAALGDVELELETDYERGMACLWTGDARGAIEAHGRIVEATGAARSITRWSTVTKLASRAYLSRALASCGRFDEAAARAAEALRIAEEAESATNTIIAGTALAHVHELRGEFDRAVPLLERALATAREHEVTLLVPAALGSLARAYGMVGRAGDGLAALEQFLAAAAPATARASVVYAFTQVGELCLAAGDVSRADGFATRSLAMARQGGLLGWEADALHVLGNIAAVRRPADLETAERYHREALARAADLGLHPLVARCQLGLGTVYREMGRWLEARTALDTASRMLREMGMVRWQEEAEAH